jgi:hypothetical protein
MHVCREAMGGGAKGGATSALITPSSGVHITLPAHFCGSATGLIVPRTRDGRVCFLLPWLGAAVAGTTDAPTALTHLPAPTAGEVDFILGTLGEYLAQAPTRRDVLSAWSGIRPLAADASKGSTENITRDHVLTVDAGVVTITGGKWTTYRKVRAPAPHAERPRLPCAMMCARLTRAWLSLRWRRTLWMPPWLTLDCSKMVGRASRRGCPSLERAAGTPAWRSGWRSKLSPRRSPWTPRLRRTSPTRMVTALRLSWMWRSKRARNSLLPAGPSWRLRLFIAHGRSFA